MKRNAMLIVILLVAVLITGCNNNNENRVEKSKNDTKESVSKDSDSSTGKIKSDNEIYQKRMPKEEKIILKNIKVDFKKTKNGSYVAFITNNNSFVIPELEISVNFYKNGLLVDTDKDGHDVILPGYTVVSSFDSYEENDDANYVISIEWSNSYRNHSKIVEMTYNLNSSNDVLVQVKNSSSELIEEIEVIAIFYDKDGKILGASYPKDIIDVKAGSTATEKLHIYDYKLRDSIKAVKVFINQAHTFGL